MSERGASDFRERARVEADRYGPDPWIFVRELLQNARDAGARSVSITIESRGGATRIRCRDDGEGMGYDHAKRYLFSLYASSKEQHRNQVGRFGVGFWSILRFDPARIVIRSCPRRTSEGGPWQVTLDGALQHAERTELELEPGTEIILERPGYDPDDERRVFDAADQNARFLCQRDDPDAPLPITVNGRRVNASFALPAPSSSFRRGRVRGVVGLGSAPRVELFSRGLRVRSAACLDDLLSSAGHTNHSRVRFPELPGGLAPQALLESDGLELLLSRSDARDTRALRRLVKLGQDELRQLVERQLAQLRPPSIGERLAGLARRLVGESTWWRAVLGALTGAVLAVLIAQLLWPEEIRYGAGLLDGGRGRKPSVAAPLNRKIYTPLRERYQGPQVSELAPEAAEPLGLHYLPKDARPYFAALIVEDVSGSAATSAAVLDDSYPSQTCDEGDGCIDIVLPIVAHRGDELPLPLPTGHRLDVASIEYSFADGAPSRGLPLINAGLLAGPKRVLLSDADEPILVVGGSFEGALHYRSGPGPAIHRPPRTKVELPEALRTAAGDLRALPLRERVGAAVDLVRERIKYRTDRNTATRHNIAIATGQDFVARALEIGAGDCDVLNGLLVAVLHAADVDARLAVGWTGHDGGVSHWLHAWVEYLDEDGRYRIADATASVSGPNAIGIPAPPPEVVTGNVDAARVEAGEPTLDEPASSPAQDSNDAPPTAAEPPPAPTPPTAAEPDARATPLPPVLRWLLAQAWLPYAALGSALLGLILLVVSLSRRTARRFDLDESGDLSSLLQGALAQPAAFRHLPSLFHRRLIPLRGGAALSLNHARALASEGRLYAGREQTQLSQAARRRGLPLLDADSPEGRTVAASLGAIDLDRWGQRLERAAELPILARLTAYLRRHGERWRCGALAQLGGRVATLDLRPLGARRSIGDRLVLIDRNDPWLSEAEQLETSRPDAAAFALLDHLLDHLDLADEERAQLLAPLARAALLETARAEGGLAR